MRWGWLICLFLIGCTYRSDSFVFEPDRPIESIPTPPAVVVPGNPIPAPTSPTTSDTTLPLPEVSLPSGTYFYGQALTFQTKSDAPPAARVEWSTDEGKTWLTNPSLLLSRPVQILTRTRLDQRISPSLRQSYQIKYRRVLILGNSILQNQPIPNRGWLGNWGMAASAPDKDFASLLERRLQSLHPDVVIRKVNVAAFENQFWTYDISVWKDLTQWQPDLVIVRLGDNVDDLRASNEKWSIHLRRLLDYLLGSPPYPARLLCTSSFYEKEVVNSETLVALSPPVVASWVPLMHLNKREGMTAISFFPDPEVGAHPSDLGMQAIADSIWAGLGPHPN